MAIEIEIGGVLAGFRIERLIGSGAMGAVYLSEDVHLQRKVAVKVLAPELAADERFRKRFLVESQLAASLDHPNIVPIYAAGEEGGHLYLAMRYVEGYDLRELVDSTPGGLDPAQAVRLLGPVADALDAAHALGLVHRDVKPANVLVAAETEQPYLCDFGLARHAMSAESLTGTQGSSARSPTSRRSRSARATSTPGPTSTRSAASSSSALQARRRTPAPATSRSSSPTSTSRRRSSRPPAPLCRRRSTRSCRRRSRRSPTSGTRPARSSCPTRPRRSR